MFATFTPLLGRTTLVERFTAASGTGTGDKGDKGKKAAPDRALITLRLEDAGHLSAADRRRILASYPPHEREVRANGVPVLGTGQVFDVAEEDVLIRAFRRAVALAASGRARFWLGPPHSGG